MKTKKIEQNGLTKKISFGKSFYALVCGLAIALAGGSYFLVSAGDIQIQTDIDNAVQTIKRIIVTSDGTADGTKYFDFNPGNGEAAIFDASIIKPRKIIQDLGLDIDGNLVKEAPPNNLDDGDRVILGNDVYKTGNVSIGDLSPVFDGNLNVISSESNKPELYIRQSSNSASNIYLEDMNNTVWTVGVDPNVGNSTFYIGRPGQSILYMDELYNAGVNSNFTISGSLDMKTHDIKDVDIINAVAFVMSSDKKLKENINVIKNPLDKIYALNGYTFDWKKSGEHSIGLIAQEVEKILPELVFTDKITGMKGVEYQNIVAVLIEGIKELGNKIDLLYDRYLNQQAKIDALELRIKALENR